MAEIFYLGIGILIGISIVIGVDIAGYIQAKIQYERTIAIKNKHIDKLLDELEYFKGGTK